MADDLLVKKNWPYGNIAALSIDIDDIHPEGSSDAEGMDFGGDMDSGNFRYLNKLITELDELTITLFVTPNWVARPDWPSGKLFFLRPLLRKAQSYHVNMFKVDNEKYKYWCNWLSDKVSTGKFEVALHGLQHQNPSSRFTSQEFAGLSLEGCLRKLNEAEKILENAHIPYVKGLRPPGWGITKELLEAIKIKNYLFLAGSSDFKTKISPEARSNGAGLKGTALFYPELYEDSLVLFTANCYANQIQRAQEIASLEGLILIHSHIAETAFGLNSISDKFVEGVKKIAKEVTSKFGNVLYFSSLGEVATWWLTKENIRVEAREMKNKIIVRINNKSKFNVKGFTLKLKDSDNKRSISSIKLGTALKNMHYEMINDKSFWVDILAGTEVTLKLETT